MNWIAFSIFAYFLIALEVILDKFLISSKRVSHPAVYAFYSGVLSLSAFIFFPFGFHLVSGEQVFLSLAAGIIFVYAVLALFFAFREGEASRVVPVVGAIVPLVTYFLSVFFLKERLGCAEIAGVFFLILGGVLIAFELNKKLGRRFFAGFYYSILAGVLLAVSYTLFKNFYEQDKFINVYIWTRFGVMFGALSLFFFPVWRRLILASLGNFKKPSGENKSSGIIFVLNKALGGAGSILKEFATSIGSVTIVNALIATEYVFVFVLGIAFSFWLPRVFKEEKDAKTIIQKIAAIILIASGVILVSNYR